LKITVRVQIDADTAEEQGTEQFSEVFVLEREEFTDASVGLSLTEAHALLGSIQEAMVSAQATAAVAERSRCARCGRSHRRKDTRTITVQTLFGTLHLDSPRFLACPCQADDAQERATFTPTGHDPDPAQYSGAGLPAGPVRRGDVVQPGRAPAW
jgi:hypothetical protein